MPELPEVEITRRRLAPLLLGRRVVEVRTTRDGYFFLTPPRELRRRLLGRRFETLERRGKYLVAGLNGGERLLLHLGMTGRLFSGGVPDAHTHLRLRFEDAGPELLFRDVRKFGKVQVLAAGESSPRLARLGPDALAASPAQLHTAGRRRRAPVKTLLLDQSVLAGVGNIYADEALFLAGLSPRRPACRLSRQDCVLLARALKRVLRRAISDGAGGRYRDEGRVYGRAGEPCRRCRTPIRRVVIGQRSSHYCPRCQR